mmetsp:Transcript_29679/g.36129  ORF Transcript_29679/g.36129 Transcript_29679/m.36129 type:complete len:89 (+) Transcript_29679:116-382(+)
MELLETGGWRSMRYWGLVQFQPPGTQASSHDGENDYSRWFGFRFGCRGRNNRILYRGVPSTDTAFGIFPKRWVFLCQNDDSGKPSLVT